MPYPTSWYFIQYCFWPKNLFHSQRSATVCSWLWDSLVLFTDSPPSKEAGKKMEWPLKSQLHCQLGGSSLEIWGMVLQKSVYTLNHCPVYGTVSPIARIHMSRNQGVEKWIVPLSIASSDQLGTFWLAGLMTLSSTCLEFFNPEGQVHLPES